MTEQAVAVRSNLKLVLTEHNAKLLRAGEDAWTQDDLAKKAEVAPSVVW